ncbi:helicase-associated domain-containing protein [Microbacterium sp. NPDC089987]|uniref:helicase-associated domain-containing protein n=1 Tax=Microbacterium sp. NPDC089987 TaxID=3364202 RepID=UPI0037FCC531
MSTHARPLADQLASASDAQLERVLRERAVRPDVGWTDFFDAAEALLEPASIERALARLTRAEARALRAAASGDRVALDDTALGLLDGEGRLLPPVRAVVESQPEIPDAADAVPSPASDADSAQAAERAFATIGSLAELLLAARTAPLALLATGALSATEKRRLLDDGDLDELRDLAELAGLVRRVDRELRLTADAERWLDASFPERWAHVASRFAESLPSGIRSSAAADWPRLHPWDPHWPARAAHLRSLAWRIGLLTGGSDGTWTVPAWGAALRADSPFDSSALQALLPTEVDRIFLQNDLSAIAPGPLQPSLDNRLRAMTDHDPAQASSYRFTAESVSRALVEGDTGEGILTFLRQISLTGVPQPLEYLVRQTATRHGLVRVRPDAEGGTVVTSADPHLLEAMEIDRNLRPLGLIREDDGLVSRVGAEAVAWALTDARYPATLVDRDGRSVAAGRARIAGADAQNDPGYTALIARLRSHQGADADAAWLDRELEAAVRARSVVIVEVAMPDGSRRELTLEASGLGGGRLRGRDRAADVERTLPVRSIVSVRAPSS